MGSISAYLGFYPGIFRQSILFAHICDHCVPHSAQILPWDFAILGVAIIAIAVGDVRRIVTAQKELPYALGLWATKGTRWELGLHCGSVGAGEAGVVAHC